MSKEKDILIRIYVVYIIIVLFGAGILVKLFHVQFADGSALKSEANDLIYDMRTIEAPKGNIYASDEQKLALAISVPRYNIAIDPFCINQLLWDEQIDSLSIELSALFPEKNAEEWKTKLATKEGIRFNMF